MNKLVELNSTNSQLIIDDILTIFKYCCESFCLARTLTSGRFYLPTSGHNCITVAFTNRISTNTEKEA